MYEDLLDANGSYEAQPDQVRPEVVRAGSRTLSVFTYSLTATVLGVHADDPLRASDLQARIGWAAPSSLRAAVAHLCDRALLAKVGAGRSQGSSASLTPAGQAFLPVAAALELWLQQAPQGPIALDSAAARGVIKVLNAGWNSSMVRAMAERPLTLDEINDSIPEFSYPALKRRLAKLRSTGLVLPHRRGRTTAYTASDWLRAAVVPLAIAAQWERKHDIEAQPISAIEVDAAFLLTLPFLRLGFGDTGSCTLAVATAGRHLSSEHEIAGVAVEVEGGKVVTCRSSESAPREPATWALGTLDAWLDAVLDGDLHDLRISGVDGNLAEELVICLHRSLFRG